MTVTDTSKPNVDSKWEFWIDRGGTFTDIVARKPVHPMRFRGNIYLDGIEAWEEFNWLDKTISIGGQPVLDVMERTTRCAAINVDPETGERDMSLPRTLDAGFGHEDCGIYARVSADAIISEGDNIEIID